MYNIVHVQDLVNKLSWHLLREEMLLLSLILGQAVQKVVPLSHVDPLLLRVLVANKEETPIFSHIFVGENYFLDQFISSKAVAIELLEPAFCDGKPASFGAEAGFPCGFRTDQPSGLSPPGWSVRRSFRPAFKSFLNLTSNIQTLMRRPWWYFTHSDVDGMLYAASESTSQVTVTNLSCVARLMTFLVYVA